MRLVIDWYHEGISIDDAAARVHELYDEYTEHDWCHTISNAMLVVIGILFGGGDFAKSICPIVQAGFDTGLQRRDRRFYHRHDARYRRNTRKMDCAVL